MDEWQEKLNKARKKWEELRDDAEKEPYDYERARKNVRRDAAFQEFMIVSQMLMHKRLNGGGM